MVLILDGNSKLHTHVSFVEKKKNRFVTALDHDQCLEQIRSPGSLHTCAPISELPSNVRARVSSAVCIDDFCAREKLNIFWNIRGDAPIFGCCWFMVLILDGNLDNAAHAWRKKGLFGEEKKYGLCLKQIK